MNIIELQRKRDTLYKNYRKELIDLITDFVKEHGTVKLLDTEHRYNGYISPYYKMEYNENLKKVFVVNVEGKYLELKWFSVSGLFEFINCLMLAANYKDK